MMRMGLLTWLVLVVGRSPVANRGVAGFVSVTDGRREIRSTHC